MISVSLITRVATDAELLTLKLSFCLKLKLGFYCRLKRSGEVEATTFTSTNWIFFRS